MLEPGGDPGLAHGPPPRLVRLLLGQARLEHELLDRDQPLETFVPGLPDDAHRAAAPPFDQPVVPADQLPRVDDRLLLVNTLARTSLDGSHNSDPVLLRAVGVGHT